MEEINVFATSDDNYAPYVATTIASIMLHTKSYIRFFLIDCGISNENIIKIKEEEKIFSNLKIEIVKIDISKVFCNFPTMIHLSSAMYGKYLISNVKNDIEKIIYTDIDVCFVDDIKILWDEPMEGFTLAAVPSQRYRLNNNYEELKKQLGIPIDHTYFMSGLMLIDCVKWRNNNVTNKLLNKTIELETFPDQEVLNSLFVNNYKKLDAKYCVIYKLFKDCYSDEEIKRLKTDQVIVHYPGGGISKPWNNPFLKSGEYFNKVLKYTKFSREIRKQQKSFIMRYGVEKVLRRLRSE